MSTHFNAVETAKHTVDALSIGVVLGTLADILPAVAALFTIVWTALRIIETDTVQRWLNRKRGSAHRAPDKDTPPE